MTASPNLQTSQMSTNNPSKTAIWNHLKSHAADVKTHNIRDLFAADSARFDHFHTRHDGLLFDYSRQHITADTLPLLIDLAKEMDVEGWREKMFNGDAINTTENRAVLHTALRRPLDQALNVNGENIMSDIQTVRANMRAFCDGVHDGSWTGFTGKRLTSIVNIGIGGSDLGPYMVCEALKSWQIEGIKTYFVSNVDGSHIAETLKQIDPETTLFLVASKTFTTQETMANADTAKNWLIEHLGDNAAVAKHFAAMSTNEPAVSAFGINPDLMFPFENWVGGRFSLWSSIGLSIALSIGFDQFETLLDGAYSMDQHFQTAPLEENIPVLMALLGVWNRNFLGYDAQSILPYDQYLHRFPAFLQQLDMESNGKHVSRDGEEIKDYETGPIIFGEPGTNGQHAFFQLLHQGTSIIPCDFIAPITSQNPLGDHHKLLLTNMLAQAEAMMRGRTLSEANGNPQKVFEGNRPSNILLFDGITPYHLGQLVALYEHKTFVQGIIWNINSFDQFGVELGKEMANAILSGDNKDMSNIGILPFLQKPS